MKRLGLLGGTFNPVHLGHLMVAQMAHEQLRLDKIIFVPSNLPPHKNGRSLALPKDRYRMIRLAIRGNNRFAVSDFEINRPGMSYSVETVQFVRDSSPPGTKIYFIVGSDHVADLRTWKHVDEFCKMATFVAVYRPGFRMKRAGLRVKFIKIPGLQISSSFVRRRILAGRTVKYFVPDGVMEYIERNKLYRKL